MSIVSEYAAEARIIVTALGVICILAGSVFVFSGIKNLPWIYHNLRWSFSGKQWLTRFWCCLWGLIFIGVGIVLNGVGSLY